MVSRPARLAAASILILLALVAACTIIFTPRGVPVEVPVQTFGSGIIDRI